MGYKARPGGPSFKLYPVWMHKEWQERLEEESYSLGEEDGIHRDETPPVRFDALFAKGTSARFGAAYFIDAAKSMSWLVRALERFGGVASVVRPAPRT